MKTFKFASTQSKKASQKVLVLALGLSLAGSSLALSACSTASQANMEPLAKISLAENELDQVVGSYTYEGKTNKITARQAIEDAVSLDTAKKDDGSYRVPSADMILTYARNAVLNSLVEKNGISASDDDITKYLKAQFNLDSIADLAKNYNMSEDQAKKILKETVGVQKLREQVSSEGSAPVEPSAPAVPEEGKESEATEAYAEYLISLLGDEWDANAATWARQDGPYYHALKDMGFDGKTATFELAQTAYYIAFSNYNSQQESLNQKWTEYLNSELAKASIEIKVLGTF